MEVEPARNLHLRTFGPRAYLIAVLLLLAVQTLQMDCAARNWIQRFDEADHLLAGYRYWQCADFGINPEHPPLLKLVAASAILPMHANASLAPCASDGTGMVNDFRNAFKWLYANDADSILFRARMAAGIFLPALSLLMFFAAREMFGVPAALLTLAVTAFEPNLLAYGPTVLTDLAISCCLFAAVFALYRLARRPTFARLLLCGFAVGLTLAAKHSGILVFPILIALAGTDAALSRRDSETSAEGLLHRHPVLGWAGTLTLTFLLGIAVLWSTYEFRFAARPNGVPMTVSLANYIKTGQEFRGEKTFVVTRAIPFLAERHLLPESYLYGLANVLMLSQHGRPVTIRGITYRVGQWFYFPWTFLTKLTLASLVMLVLSIGNRSFWRIRKRELLYLVIPVLLFMAAAMRSQLNLGLRHLLPVFPFVIILASAGMMDLASRRRGFRYALGLLLAFHVVASASAYPRYETYANELSGRSPRRLMLWRNQNHGSEVVLVKRYLARKHISDCWIAVTWAIDADYYGLPCRRLPTLLVPFSRRVFDVIPLELKGTILVASDSPALRTSQWGYGIDNPYSAFAATGPVDTLPGINIYQGTFQTNLFSALSHSVRARQLAEEGRMEEALNEADQGIQMAPDHWDTWARRAEVLQFASRRTEAARDYRDAIRIMQTRDADYFNATIGRLGAEVVELEHDEEQSQRRPSHLNPLSNNPQSRK
jgi:4-amino-4-deoxy-L-arabinose transferase-like glycosyltransferase